MRTAFKAMTAALMLTAAFAQTAPAPAGPLPTSLAAISAAAPHAAIGVRSRGRGAGVAAGIAAGVITGAIIAGAANSYYYGAGPYYGPGYYYGSGYYEPPSYYYPPRYYRYREPVYVAPPPVVYVPRVGHYGPRGRCWVVTDDHRGYGYWRPC